MLFIFISKRQASPCVIEIHDSTTECGEDEMPDQVQLEEKTFVTRLHSFMKEKGTPIERIPHLGFKQSALNEHNLFPFKNTAFSKS